MTAVAIRLRELRHGRHLSQRELAEQAGIRRDTISALARGDSRGIQFDTLARLCAVLDCAPGELFAPSHDEPALVLGGPDGSVGNSANGIPLRVR